MFREYIARIGPDKYNPEGRPFKIIDSDFEETVDISVESIWRAIMIVYSKRNLNPYSNLVLALKWFTGSIILGTRGMNYMLAHLKETHSDVIDINRLNKYLILL